MTYVFRHVCVFAVQAVALLINVHSASVIGHVANEGTLPLADQYKTMWNHQWLQLTLRRLMSYIYGAPILDVSRSHTTTQHSR